MEENMSYETIDETEDVSIPGESKAEKFKRLAEKRTQNALKQISGIGKLSSSAYEYTPEQIEKIFGALQSALDTARNKFEKNTSEKEEFSL